MEPTIGRRPIRATFGQGNRLRLLPRQFCLLNGPEAHLKARNRCTPARLCLAGYAGIDSRITGKNE